MSSISTGLHVGDGFSFVVQSNVRLSTSRHRRRHPVDSIIFKGKFFGGRGIFSCRLGDSTLFACRSSFTGKLHIGTSTNKGVVRRDCSVLTTSIMKLVAPKMCGLTGNISGPGIRAIVGGGTLGDLCFATGFSCGSGLFLSIAKHGS